MNKKISKILGVGMTIAMLASLLVMATPASASALGWGEDAATKNLKGNADTANRLLANTDIGDLAINGQTLYAATADNATATVNAVYKSTDGGVTWGTLKNTTDYPTLKTVTKVAVAKDDAKSVAILTTDSTVYYSSDGGSSWQNAGKPAAAALITDIDLSAGSSKYIAAAGSAGGVAELYILKATGGLGTGWDARYNTAAGALNTQTNIFAVKFSPNYNSDKIVTVVSGNATNVANFQVFRNETTALRWNASIATYTDSDPSWATGIAVNGGTALIGGIAGADIALVPTYLGSDAATRDAFVAVAGVTSGGGVTRLADTTATALTVAGGSVSVAYNATSGALLAGSYTSNRVNRWLNPLATSPTKESIATLQQPSGTVRTLVDWVGSNAVAGTAGDESAFAISTDAGKTFNDAGLIDTLLTTISDIAVNAANSKIYMTTVDTTDTDDVSVWLKTTAWNRVLTFRDYAGGTKFLVRIAPENDAVVYIASQGTASTTADNMWVSKDSGTTWTNITNSVLTSVQDFVVDSATMVYAIDTTGLSKSSDSGASWGTKVIPANAIAAFSVTLATNSANVSDVLIGGSDGYVAFSKDGGATLTRTLITVAANAGFGVQVVADKDYATNNVIYAGVNAAVYRGKADATTSFAARSPVFDATYTTPSITGLVRDGSIIYAASSNGTVSALSSALNLTPTVTSAANALWSNQLTSSSYKFTNTPSSLRLVNNHVLWEVTNSLTIASFTETNATQGPTIAAPANNFVVPVNVTTGRAFNVSFTFNRPAGDTSGNTNYFRLQIATDTAFGGIVYDNIFTDIDETPETRIIGPNGVTNQIIEFMPNSTYYWRIRVEKGGATLQSLWSETRTLKVDKTAPAVAPIPFDIVSPVRGAADIPINTILTWTPFEGAIGYEVALATDDTFKIIDFSHNVPVSNLFYASEPLNYNTTYYWRVRGVTGPAPAKAAAPGGPWATGAFTTMAQPAAPAATVAPPATTPPQIIIQKEPAEIKVVEVPVSTPAPIPSYLLWIIIIIGAVLIIALITLIARTRRVT